MPAILILEKTFHSELRHGTNPGPFDEIAVSWRSSLLRVTETWFLQQSRSRTCQCFGVRREAKRHAALDSPDPVRTTSELPRPSGGDSKRRPQAASSANRFYRAYQTMNVAQRLAD